MTAEDQRTRDSQMVRFTETARTRILEILDNQGLRDKAAVRVAISGRGPAGFTYQMGLDDGGPGPDDMVIDQDGFQVLVDRDSASKLKGATVDFEDQLMGGGFRIHNPNPVWDDPLAQEIQNLIDAEVNPAVAAHGGVVQLIDVKQDNVYVRLGGGCQGCGMVDVTLRQGIEVLIKERFPQVQAVIDTTDHAGGSNPYYQPAKGSPGAAPQGGGCGAPGCGAGGHAHAHGPYHQPSKG